MTLKTIFFKILTGIKKILLILITFLKLAINGMKKLKIKDWCRLIISFLILGIIIDEIIQIKPFRHITYYYGTCVKAVIYDKYLNHTARWDNFYFYYYQFNYNGKQYRDAFHRLKGHQDMQIGDSIPVFFFPIYPNISYEKDEEK